MPWRGALAAALLAIALGATGAQSAAEVGFGGVSIGDSEADVHRLFPNVDCRVVAGLKSPYRCFVKAFAWGMPTGVWFMFRDHGSPVDSIVLNFAPQYYGHVLRRLVLEFGQATDQTAATVFWKVGKAGIILDARQGKGENFLVFMTSDAVIDRGRMK